MRAYIKSVTLEVWWRCKRKENHSVAATSLSHSLSKEMIALKYVFWDDFFRDLLEIQEV